MNRENYPSDLTDQQWAALEPLIPEAAAGRRRRHVNLREVVNAIRYLEATGCGWSGLPQSFPHRWVVWHHYAHWHRHNLWAVLSRVSSELQKNSAGHRPIPLTTGDHRPSQLTAGEGAALHVQLQRDPAAQPNSGVTPHRLASAHDPA